MEDLTGNLMAGIVVGLSRMMGAPVLKVIDSLGVGETEEERQVGNRAWTKMISVRAARFFEDGHQYMQRRIGRSERRASRFRSGSSLTNADDGDATAA